MNSIETSTAPLQTVAHAIQRAQNGEGGERGDQAPDGADLGILRALLGGEQPPSMPLSNPMPLSPTTAEKPSLPLPTAQLSQLLSDALTEGFLPLPLQSVAQELQQRFQQPGALPEDTLMLLQLLRDELASETRLSTGAPGAATGGDGSLIKSPTSGLAPNPALAGLPGNGAGSALPMGVGSPAVDAAELQRAELAAALTAILGDGEETAPARAASAAPTSLPAESTAAETPVLGNAILQSLAQQSSSNPAAAADGVPSASVISDRIEQVSALMTQMADRVLVTDPLSGQTAEVRIKVADNLMPDTEVRVWRTPDGQLRVDFETASAFWARALNESSTQLTQRLNERFAGPDSAQVTVQHQSGQPGDGRSRNRQSPWEMAQNQEEA